MLLAVHTIDLHVDFDVSGPNMVNFNLREEN